MDVIMDRIKNDKDLMDRIVNVINILREDSVKPPVVIPVVKTPSTKLKCGFGFNPE
jgi:hypothetical protein